MDHHTRTRRAIREGQARLDAALPDDEREERAGQEPDFEQLLQDRAERRALRGAL